MHLGKCVHEIAEHSHYVQGVAWDPLNEYIATQSSDRSMHIYQISTKQGSFEAHAVGKNTRMAFNHSRTPSTQSRIKGGFKRESTGDVESASVDQKEERDFPQSGNNNNSITYPPTPATSVASTPSTMFPPPTFERPSSRRSSFSGSNAPSSPAHSHFSRYGRSPSPMPPLPAIRALPSPAWSTIKLYGDESFTNFFRRLTFSPDGGLLLTPAGHFEDLSFNAGAKGDETPSRGRKGRSSDKSGSNSTQSELTNPNSASSVFIYSRANFARPPIAQLPGHKKASVAVRFSPILYELRHGVVGAGAEETKTATLDKNKEGKLAVDLTSGTGGLAHEQPAPSPSPRTEKAPASQLPTTSSEISMVCSPSSHPPKPSSSNVSASSKTSMPVASSSPSGSVFALPYRMLYAVLTMDTVTIYDTQQAGPVCLLTKLHYDEFTDMSWYVSSFPLNSERWFTHDYDYRSPDGQTLVLSSRDGYCTLIIFDEILAAHHTQQSTLQLQSIAQHNFVPLTYAASLVSTHAAPVTPANTTVGLPIIAPPVVPAKRAQLQGSELSPQQALTSKSAVEDSVPPSGSGSSAGTDDPGVVEEAKDQPPKKKRRVALTRVGDIGM